MKRVAGVLILIVAANLLPAGPVSAEDLRFGLEDYCSLKIGAPITPTCYGFMSGVMEMVREWKAFENLGQARQRNEFSNICIDTMSVTTVVTKVRAVLGGEPKSCAGRCTAAGDALAAIEQAFPCKQR